MNMMQLKLLVVLFLSVGCYGGKLFGGFGAGGGGFGGYTGLAAVNQQRFKLKGIQIQLNNSINTANTTILDNIEKNQQSLDTELSAAKTASSSAVEKCKQQFDSAVALINTKSLSNCDESGALEWVKLQSSQLFAFHAQLGPVFAQCPFWSPSADQAKCIDDYVKPIDEGAENLRDDTLKQINEIVENSNSCVDTTATEIRNTIATANQQLNDCNSTP